MQQPLGGIRWGTKSSKSPQLHSKFEACLGYVKSCFKKKCKNNKTTSTPPPKTEIYSIFCPCSNHDLECLPLWDGLFNFNHITHIPCLRVLSGHQILRSRTVPEARQEFQGICARCELSSGKDPCDWWIYTLTSQEREQLALYTRC